MSASDQSTIERDGIQWILTAGIFSVILTGLLWYIDDVLIRAPLQTVHDEQLLELRNAQVGLNSSPADSRMYEATHR